MSGVRAVCGDTVVCRLLVRVLVQVALAGICLVGAAPGPWAVTRRVPGDVNTPGMGVHLSGLWVQGGAVVVLFSFVAVLDRDREVW